MDEETSTPSQEPVQQAPVQKESQIPITQSQDSNPGFMAKIFDISDQVVKKVHDLMPANLGEAARTGAGMGVAMGVIMFAYGILLDISYRFWFFADSFKITDWFTNLITSVVLFVVFGSIGSFFLVRNWHRWIFFKNKSIFKRLFYTFLVIHAILFV